MGFWRFGLVCISLVFFPCAHVFCLSITFWALKEKQPFTSHWTLCSWEHGEEVKCQPPPCSDLGPTSQPMCSRPGLEAQQVLKHGGTELY